MTGERAIQASQTLPDRHQASAPSGTALVPLTLVMMSWTDCVKLASVKGVVLTFSLVLVCNTNRS